METSPDVMRRFCLVKLALSPYTDTFNAGYALKKAKYHKNTNRNW